MRRRVLTSGDYGEMLSDFCRRVSGVRSDGVAYIQLPITASNAYANYSVKYKVTGDISQSYTIIGHSYSNTYGNIYIRKDETSGDVYPVCAWIVNPTTRYDSIRAQGSILGKTVTMSIAGPSCSGISYAGDLNRVYVIYHDDNDKKVTCDGIDQETRTTSSSSRICIFADSSQSAVNDKVVIYSASVKDYSGQMELIPCVLTRNITSSEDANKIARAEGLYGFYDVVSGKFVGNAASSGQILLEKGAQEPTYSNGHEYVDLGLPSGTMWATCNVGANSETDYGNYYAWYDGSKKNTDGTSITYIKNGTGASITNLAIGTSPFVGYPTFDTATAEMRGRWCMPTVSQIEELFGNCNSSWTSKNGVEGKLFTSRINGNSIFFPAGGGYMDGTNDMVGFACIIWSATFGGYSASGDPLAEAMLLSSFEDMSSCGAGQTWFAFNVRGVFVP